MTLPKLYLYDSSQSDYKGTDYSQYILSGFNYTDDLTEVLDVCDLTLVGIDRSEEFAPTTKFILEIWDYVKSGNAEVAKCVETYHLCVANDVVSQPILSDEHYFTHSITFNEASIIAQGRVVDDMTLTYKLKNVSLTAQVTYNPNELAPPTNNEKIKNVVPSNITDNNQHTVTGVSPYLSYTDSYTRKFEFVFSSSYMQSSDPNYGDFSTWSNFLKYQVVSSSRTVNLPIPLIVTYFGAQNSTDFETHRNFCAVRTILMSRNRGNTSWTTEQDFITKPALANATEADWQKDWRFAQLYAGTALGYGVSRSYVSNKQLVTKYKKYTDFAENVENRFLSFTITPNKEYKIVITLPNWETDPLLGSSTTFAKETDENFYIKSYCSYSITSVTAQGNPQNVYISDAGSSSYVNTNLDGKSSPSLSMEFTTVPQSITGKIMFHEAPPISAYDLFIEAQLKTQTTYKTEGEYIKNKKLPFYCNDEDIVTLQNTQVIESAFHQKNFWEVLLEIGKYIHAIPFVEFGEDDRLLVRWRYLGQTTKSENQSVTMSIFNSRSIENYVGAVNSYVTNMVQLGGEIDEWISPKSESDDFLVYNDVAVIKTSKIITEITYLGVKCINPTSPITDTDEQDITDCVFEKYVYDLLGIDANLNINKGLAIYYNLGENVIRGLNYQLPSVNTGAAETEYAIKRILGKKYQISTGNYANIKINNFAFHIKYRTKESVRSEQSRPDLRKYLINSKYEQVPHHIQFNNQQDVSVDSDKFGNKSYGSLIRTGNTEYQTTEWVNYASELKKAGELVELRGNLYYVSKAKHTYFQDHIDIEISYSKDYNQLSEIIGIPSEPRFYEISERNLIDRQVVINDYYAIGTKRYGKTPNNYIGKLLTSSESYPKYAISQIKNDANNPDTRVEGLSSFAIDLIHPISAYSMRNTLSLKWEMVDNFSAGDRVEDANTYIPNHSSVDTAYATLLPTQYTDAYGRADLIDFAIIDNLPDEYKTADSIRNFPLSPIRLLGADILYTYKGIASYYTDEDGTHIPLSLTTTGFVIYETSYGHPATGIYDSANNVLVDGDSVSVGDYIIVEGTGVAAVFACTKREEDGYVWSFIFALNDDLDIDEIKNAPSIYDTSAKIYFSTYQNDLFGTNQHGVALLKDCRECIKLNYNVQMLTDSDRFVLSGYMWQQNKPTVYVATLNYEVNKIVNDTIPADGVTLISPAGFSSGELNLGGEYGYLANVDMTNVKAVALVTEASPEVGSDLEYYFVMARNVDGLTDDEKRANWFITKVQNTFFENQ